ARRRRPGAARALDARSLPHLPRPAHHAADRRGEVGDIVNAAGASVSRRAAARSVAAAGPQSADGVSRHHQRRAPPWHARSQRCRGCQYRRRQARQAQTIGRDIPSPDEVRRILAAAPENWRALLAVAAFTGLRASELRGLRWADIDLKTGTVQVRQRADAWGKLGHLKSTTSERAIPVGPFVVNTLKAWKLKSPSGDLVFPPRDGEPFAHVTLQRAGYWAAQCAAGVVNGVGKPKYPGLHTLRHFFASWCINRRRDGGLELPLKLVQQRLGHATIAMT